MASGKKNYFRHSFFAHEDPKLQKVIDEMGFEGYGYYFSLLELCGRVCADGVQNPVAFHIQTLKNVWRKHTKSCIKVLEKLHKSGLFVVTFKESLVELDIPNFAKYLGKYESKLAPNTPNKIKENKRKEKKKSSAEKQNDELESFISDSISFLNTTLSTKFQQETKSTRDSLSKLFLSYKLPKIKQVVLSKQKDWGGDPNMRKYLRPRTLFGNKFPDYLEESTMPSVDEFQANMEKKFADELRALQND